MFVLVDSSVWIDHLRATDERLFDLLDRERIVQHPSVHLELMLGSLAYRVGFGRLLDTLPIAPIATDNEVMTLIEERRLYSRGIGYVDAHLVASSMLANELLLWTRDRRLRAVVDEFEIGVGWT